MPAADVAAALHCRPDQGLSPHQVSSQRAAYGPNALQQSARKSFASILGHQFKSVIMWLLAAAALMSFAMGDAPEALAIVAVLAINTALGTFTELQAARSMEALLRIAEVQTRVRRGGTERTIDSREIVPGDIVILDAGDIVSADLRLIAASGLEIDESVLTGESAPVAKSVAAVAPSAVIGDRSCMAYRGTAITKGTGEAIVVATGMDTEIGRISTLAQGAESSTAPLEKRLDRLGGKLVWLTLLLAGLTILAGIMRGQDPLSMLQTGVALAVAAVPEGLAIVATLCLARGMWRMSTRNALIRQLSSVETLGATTIILTDKTGTLTENRMSVTRYLLCTGDVEITERSLPARERGAADPLLRAVQIGALCNTAKIEADNAAVGDPMELALLALARRCDLSAEALTPPLRTFAFDPDRRLMATVHEESGTHYLCAVKGGPEAVLAHCTSELTDAGPRAWDEDRRRDWEARVRTAAAGGLRLLGLAMKISDRLDEDPYEGLTLVGVVGLLDPVREGVRQAIEASRQAGVRVVMVTGDHAATAGAIARLAGLGSDDMDVLDGDILVGIDASSIEPDARERVLQADVLARVAPEDKLDLVALYQDDGNVVAMTGDGVNDAPALKKADIGIAMGQRGTEVAKEAAHMVLRDDAFETIIVAMRQGRAIFENIRKFVVYLMSCNLSEVLVVALAVAGGLPTPLLPLQILFLNLVTDIFPAFALGLGQGHPDLMRKPPRDPKEGIVETRHWVTMGVLGGLITLSTLGAFTLSLFWLEHETDTAITVAFLTLALSQVWNVFNMRSASGRLFDNEVTRNPYVWGAIAICLALLAAAIWQPSLAALLKLQGADGSDLFLAAAASLVPLVLGQAWLALEAKFQTAPRQGH